LIQKKLKVYKEEEEIIKRIKEGILILNMQAQRKTSSSRG
jgi:hypothetical protein